MKKTFLPSSTASLRTICCSGLRMTFCLMSIELLVSILLLMPAPPADAPPTVWKLDDPERDAAFGWGTALTSQGMGRFFEGPAADAEVE